MSSDQFEQVKTRLKRILNRCGWTIHLRQKPSGIYVRAAKRDESGKWQGKYIAPLHRIPTMSTTKIIAILKPPYRPSDFGTTNISDIPPIH